MFLVIFKNKEQLIGKSLQQFRTQYWFVRHILLMPDIVLEMLKAVGVMRQMEVMTIAIQHNSNNVPKINFF